MLSDKIKFRPYFILFICFFGCAYSIWKFPSPGLNWSYSSDNAGSLTCWATRELPKRFLLCGHWLPAVPALTSVSLGDKTPHTKVNGWLACARPKVQGTQAGRIPWAVWHYTSQTPLSSSSTGCCPEVAFFLLRAVKNCDKVYIT